MGILSTVFNGHHKTVPRIASVMVPQAFEEIKDNLISQKKGLTHQIMKIFNGCHGNILRDII